DDADPELRCLLVRLLAKVHAPVSSALLRLLSDPEPRVVSTVVQALGRLGDAVAVAPLAALLGDPSLEASHLVDALTHFGGAAVEALGRVLAASSVPARLAALETVGRIGAEHEEHGARVAELVRPLLHDPDGEVRRGAVLALDEVGPAGRRGLEDALELPDIAPLARTLLDLHAT
ncbi:MAG TPA: HEAT repeat domain-containing protein, partial [Propionibacteriaceae bacterium]|nr:HEAT repeat domain-containing protein [Propionibacteriaceae bacterium]